MEEPRPQNASKYIQSNETHTESPKCPNIHQIQQPTTNLRMDNLVSAPPEASISYPFPEPSSPPFPPNPTVSSFPSSKLTSVFSLILQAKIVRNFNSHCPTFFFKKKKLLGDQWWAGWGCDAQNNPYTSSPMLSSWKCLNLDSRDESFDH